MNVNLNEIVEAANDLKWVLVEIRAHESNIDCNRVLARREDAPFEGRKYHTAVYNKRTQGFDSGRYDMSLEAALHSLNANTVERVQHTTL